MKNKIKPVRIKYTVNLAAGLRSRGMLQFAAIIMLMVALASCKNNSTTPAQQLPPSNDSLVVMNDTIQSEYNASRVQLDALATKNSLLDSQILVKDKAIAKLKGEVSRLKRKNRSMMASIKNDKKMIKSLEDELSDKARSFAEKIGLLQSDRDNLAKQRDELQTKYKGLKELASVLHASNFRLEALHVKHSGKEKKTARARKADVLRIYFDIDENRIAEDGTKDLYLSIKDPDGHLLKGASGSGVTNTSNGSPLDYSLLKQIALKQDEPVKDVTVDWKQDDDFKKGVYRIAIYNGGYKIGGGDVTLN